MQAELWQQYWQAVVSLVHIRKAPGKKFKDGGAESFNWPFNQSNELLVKVAWAYDEIGV